MTDVAALVGIAGLGFFCIGALFAFDDLTNRVAPAVAGVGIVMFLIGSLLS